MPTIRKLGIRCVFTQCAQVMLAIKAHQWNSVCYCFPSVKNEVEYSRYRWARYLARPYEWALFNSLQRADLILAAADSSAIEALVARSKGRLERSKIVSFPTRADTRIFHPQDRITSRKALGLSENAKILLSCGKLMYIKGWALLLAALKIIKSDQQDVQLVFLGDGEDHEALKDMAKKLQIYDIVHLAGVVSPTEVATYMNAADLLVVGSIQEGWSVAMVEALSCGLPVVSTDVSGARDLICNGKNGYVVETRDAAVYAKAVKNALNIVPPVVSSLEIAANYSLDKLSEDLARYWTILRR